MCIRDRYYLYGSKGMISSQYPPGFDVYRCETLDGDWEGPYPAFSPGEDFWGYHGHYLSLIHIFLPPRTPSAAEVCSEPLPIALAISA